VVPDLPPIVAPPTLAGATPESLLAEARSRRPDLAAARASVASAEAGLALARRQRLPDVAVTAGYQQEGTGQQAIQPPTATVGLSLPLPLFYRNAGEIEKAEAALHAQTIQRSKLDAQVASDVSSAFAAYQSADARVARMQSRLLDEAGRARDLVEYQYKRGAASLLEVLEAQRTYVATNAEYFHVLGDYWSSLYQLEEAIGVEIAP
jgi:cobalt-zinc-cadmium efflux system outer membrane protein